MRILIRKEPPIYPKDFQALERSYDLIIFQRYLIPDFWEQEIPCMFFDTSGEWMSQFQAEESFDHKESNIVIYSVRTADEFLKRFCRIDMTMGIKKCLHCNECFTSPPHVFWEHIMKHIFDEIVRDKSRILKACFTPAEASVYI